MQLARGVANLKAMTLELTEGEVGELARALDLHLERLQDEIVHTDDRDYGASLKATYEVIERVRRRLEERQAVEPPLLA